MQIMQIVVEFGQGGGVEHVAYELQRAWRQAGVDTRVLTAAMSDERHRAEADFVVPWVARIGIRGRSRYLGRMLVLPLFTIAASLKLRSVRGERMVVSHGDSFGGDICVVHAVNKASLAEKQRQGGRLWRLNPMHAWVGLRDRAMIGGLRFARYVAVSSRVASELQAFYGVPAARIAVIPNGVNTERFQPGWLRADAAAWAAERAAVRQEFAIPAAAPLLLFTGHEFARKGLGHVVGALGRLGGDVHALVVGADNPAAYRAQAAQAGVAAGRLVFAGRRGDLPRLYAAADAFVFPTYYEAFPLVCLEAMAAGLPLFATRVGGIEDCLVEGVSGSFITRDADDIAARLRPVLADPALRRRLGEGARATAERYAWPEIAGRYLDLLRTVQAERAAGRPGARPGGAPLDPADSPRGFEPVS